MESADELEDRVASDPALLQITAYTWEHNRQCFQIITVHYLDRDVCKEPQVRGTSNFLSFPPKLRKLINKTLS